MVLSDVADEVDADIEEEVIMEVVGRVVGVEAPYAPVPPEPHMPPVQPAWPTVVVLAEVGGVVALVVVGGAVIVNEPVDRLFELWPKTSATNTLAAMVLPSRLELVANVKLFEVVVVELMAANVTVL